MSRGIHAPFSRLIVLNPSTPKTSGGSFDLGDGQVGLFITEPAANKRGSKAVSVYNKPNKKYFLEIGTGIKTNQGGSSTKGLRTHWFSPKDVQQVTFSEHKESTQAQVYLGYDGLDKTKTLKLKPGESAEVSLTLTGEQLAYFGFKDGKYTGTFVMKAEDADDCQETCLESSCHDRTLALIKQIKGREIREGVTIADLIDVNPVIDCIQNTITPTTDANFYCLSLCDAGDDAALGLVQAQVPGYEVFRTERDGTTSTYKILGGDSAPSDYVDYKVAIKTDCGAECDDGYTSQGSGWYTVLKAHDSGSNVAAAIDTAVEGVFGAGTATVTKISGGQAYGKYVVLFTESVDLGDVPVAYEVLQDLKEVENLCVIDADTSTSWEACGTCSRTFEYYYIDLEDDDCGSRIAELRAALPHLTIVEAAWLANGVPDGSSDLTDVASEVVNNEEGAESEVVGDCRRRYFTTVTTNVVCDECHPDTFTSEAPDSFGYEEWKKYTLGGGKVADVTVSDADASRTEGTYEGVDGTTDNNGASATFDVVVDANGDATVTIVNGGTNFQVGDTITIDDSVLGGGGAEDLVLTVSVVTEPSEDTDCVCGIMFKGKDIELCPDIDFADKVGTIKGQIEIQVSGGEMLGDRIGYKYKNQLKEGAFPVTRVSRSFDGSGWGFEYMQRETEAYDYMLGVITGNSTEERFFKNMRSKLTPCKQYDTFTVNIKNSAMSQGFSQTKTEFIRYIFVIPAGTKHIFDAFMNDIASGNPDAEVVYQ